MAFAILGAPRTTRQNRNFAIALLIVGILVVRIAGFGFSTVAVSQPMAVLAQYFLLAAVGAGSFWMIMRGVIIDAPTNLIGAVNGMFSRVASLMPR
jgi:lipopolysaccharide export system permease protein